MKEKGLYLRGETWWISYAGPNGEDVRESSKSGNPDVAKRLLKKRHQHVQNERDGIKKFTTGKQERVTLGELLDALEEDYKLNGKREGEQWRIENVRKALGGLMARSITTSRLRAYATSRQKDGTKPATISRELEFVGAAYALAIKDERLSFAPHMPELVIENVRTRFPTDDEAADVLEEIRKRSPAAYDFYLWIS